MKPYEHIKLYAEDDYPDVADIQSQARKTSIGGKRDKGYIRNKAKKAAIRRRLKRRDKELSRKEWERQ